MNINEKDLRWLERWKPQLAEGSAAASAFAFQQKLIKSQAQSVQTLAKMNAQQLVQLLTHSFGSVPLYENYSKFGNPAELVSNPKRWAELPIVRRSELQPQSERLQAKRLPKGHNVTGSLRSSGSTGTPIELVSTNITSMWQRALAFRSTIWFRREFDQTLGIIRKFSRDSTELPDGETADHWADIEGIPIYTGKRFGLEATKGKLSEQFNWLERKQPTYLMTLPSVLRELVDISIRTQSDWAPKGISTLAETVDDDLRASIKDHWKINIDDTYSAEECGVIAIQCPSHGNYHIQSESLLVEIVDEQGRVCRPGKEGEVVVTTLSNLAAPLIRYAIGDRAIAGKTCGCGRNLPVLKRILGRERNLLVTKDGKYWPSFGMRQFRERVPILSQQFRQTSLEGLEMRYTASAPLSADQEQMLKKHLQKKLPVKMQIVLRYVEDLPRSQSGKAEMFISDVVAG
ncbi:MAG: hypothetical protein ABJO09_03510 [Hyphomicrobiales bacterium]